MVDKLKEALKHDSLTGVRKILEKNDIDLNQIEIICDQYDIDDPDGVPLLFWLVQNGVSVEMLELLMGYGLDITWVNREGLGVIDVAIKAKRRDIIELCGRNGISFLETRRRSGMTPLMAAAGFGNRDLVDFFLEKGADPRQTDRRGTDAVEYARMLGHASLAKYLAGVNSKNSR